MGLDSISFDLEGAAGEDGKRETFNVQSPGARSNLGVSGVPLESYKENRNIKGEKRFISDQYE